MQFTERMNTKKDSIDCENCCPHSLREMGPGLFEKPHAPVAAVSISGAQPAVQTLAGLSNERKEWIEHRFVTALRIMTPATRCRCHMRSWQAVQVRVHHPVPFLVPQLLWNDAMSLGRQLTKAGNIRHPETTSGAMPVTTGPRGYRALDLRSGWTGSSMIFACPSFPAKQPTVTEPARLVGQSSKNRLPHRWLLRLDVRLCFSYSCLRSPSRFRPF